LIFQILPSKSGLPTIQNKENGQFLHSSFDPYKESLRTYTQYTENWKPQSIPIIWGVGLGYVLDIILEKGPYSHKMYCFEPKSGIRELEEVKKKFQGLQKKFLEKSVELILFDDPKNIQPFPKNWFLVQNPYYTKFYSSALEEFYSCSRKQNSKINQSTISHFSKLWFRNYLLNTNQTSQSDCYLLHPQTFSLNNQTIVFAGASPSLESDIPLLQKYRDRFFLLSSDTSSFTLISSGLKPDAILSIDSGRGTSYHFRWDQMKDIPIFTWLGGNREIFLQPNPKCIFFTTYPLDQIIQKFFYPNLPLLSNSSLNIAGMAESIRNFLQAKRLLLTGVSFVTERGKSHCRGTGYESYYIPKIHRTHPLELHSNSGYKKNLSPKNQLAHATLFSSSFVQNFSEEALLESEKIYPEIPKLFSKFQLSSQSLVSILSKKEFFSILETELNLTKSNLQKYLKIYSFLSSVNSVS
jgi:hypothetical protein